MSSLPLRQEEEGEISVDQADAASETQGALDAADCNAPAPAVRSARCRVVQGAVVLLVQLAAAGLMAYFVAHHGAAMAGARRTPTASLAVNASGVELMTDKFTLNKSRTGCKNAADIRLLSRRVASSDECAYWCRGMVNCKQFNYAPELPSDSDGENCVLFRAGCEKAPNEAWELYDDAGGKVTNDAAVLGFDAHWKVETNSDFWIFDDTSGCPRSFFTCPVAGVADLVAVGAPPEEHWKEAFDTVVTKRYQPGDHICEEAQGPRLLAAARLSPAGLGSRMNNFANEALWAMWAGLPLTLCTPPGYRDSWPRYFEALNLSRCQDCGGSSVFAAGACSGAYASRSLSEETLPDMKRYVYSRLFSWKPDVVQRRGILLKELNLTNDPYIGVHIRRGDKIAELNPGETYVDIDAFAQKVREACEVLGKKKSCKVFVASDWPAARNELQMRVPEMECVAQAPLSSELYNVRNDRTEDENWKDAAEASFVLDLTMLVHSDIFIGTSSSNVGRFIYFMRPENKTSVSLDNEGSFIALNC